MNGIAMMGLWAIWSIAIVWLTRVGCSALHRWLLGPHPAIAFGYVCLFLCIPLGWVITGWSSVQMYGFEPGDWKQWVGYHAFVLSPAGLPLLVGLPAAILIDGAFHRRRSAEIRKDADGD